MVHHYHYVIVLLLLFFNSISSHQHHNHDHDPSIISTMEQFSGFSILEPTSFSSLSYDAQALQNQVQYTQSFTKKTFFFLLVFDILNCTLFCSQIDELSGFSDAPAPSVTRVLYTDKDVLARRYLFTYVIMYVYVYIKFQFLDIFYVDLNEEQSVYL